MRALHSRDKSHPPFSAHEIMARKNCVRSSLQIQIFVSGIDAAMYFRRRCHMILFPHYARRRPFHRANDNTTSEREREECESTMTKPNERARTDCTGTRAAGFLVGFIIMRVRGSSCKAANERRKEVGSQKFLRSYLILCTLMNKCQRFGGGRVLPSAKP